MDTTEKSPQTDDTLGKNDKDVSNSPQPDKEYRWKFINTAILWWSFISLGWEVSQMGPVLLDIQYITSTTLGEVSTLFTAGAVGYLFASFVIGFILGRIHTNLILFAACFIAAATTAAIPWCNMYGIMIVVMIVRGAVNGVQDTGGNTLLLRMWSSDSNSYMQALHFSFAFGGIISPLVTAPFLLPEDKSAANQSSEIETTTTTNVEITSPYNKSLDSSNTESRLYYAFITTTIFYASASILFLALYLWNRDADYVSKSKNSKERKKSSIPLRLKVIIIINLLVLMWMYTSVESTFTSFLATFLVKGLSWSKTEGSYATSVFWATFCVGRFTGIFVVKLIRPSKLLILYAVGLTLAMAGLLLTSIYRINTGVWIAIAISGFACSIIFPSIFTWIEAEILEVTGIIAGLFIVAASTSGMVQPIMLGYLMDNRSSLYFCYIALGQCILIDLLYISAKCLSFKIQKYRARDEQVFPIKFQVLMV